MMAQWSRDLGKEVRVVSSVERGATVTSDLWPEPVEVIDVQPLGSSTTLTVRGTRTQELSSKVLTAHQLAALTVLPVEETHALDAPAPEFRVAVEGLRIRLAHLFDPHFAIGISQIDPLPHQLEAVYDYLLSQPRIRFLLADDPGAGKTIMAGLLIKELKHRRLADRILIVVPANLADQWRVEMHERFGETFAVLDRGAFANLYGRQSLEPRRSDHYPPRLRSPRRRCSIARAGPLGFGYLRRGAQAVCVSVRPQGQEDPPLQARGAARPPDSPPAADDSDTAPRRPTQFSLAD